MESMKKIVISLLLLVGFGLQAGNHYIDMDAAKALIALSNQGETSRPCPPPAPLDASDYQVIPLVGDNGVSVSSNEKPFACTQCKYRTAQKGHLTRHIKTHTGEQPYRCTQCNKNFADKGNLNRHMKGHTGEKPFACTQCKYRTAQRGHLTRHIKTHTGEKPYVCIKCDKSFARNDTLIRHMNNHTNQQSPK